ncbi:hypothetical protein [Natronococcus occultus]|uniref:Small CPxCG-related zinc finger protein n=1 Tax=Natronococcus occultus SP4 TaxID=694430 RepID=L0JX56_9EURY|nr:hypothetical protein [Natronococcus occultus]AGB36438.1 hypothetical protein Natoc_0577 [Natronococcus occultus SP4]
MAHTPELPEKYVCVDCQTVHAGTVVERTDVSRRYEAPNACGCCGGVEFVVEVDWPHVDR